MEKPEIWYREALWRFRARSDRDSPPAAKVAIGSGPLRDTLVLGAARKGGGSAPAADAHLSAGAEVARFVVTLQSAGGSGPVFVPGSGVSSYIQNASGRSAGAIAVGELDAQ